MLLFVDRSRRHAQFLLAGAILTLDQRTVADLLWILCCAQDWQTLFRRKAMGDLFQEPYSVA